MTRQEAQDRYELLFPSEYIKAVDLNGRDVTKTIKRVERTELKMRGGRAEKKVVIYFSDSEKKLVCNRTNADTIAKIYGPHVSSWIGQKITMFSTTTTFGSKTVDCVRIRETAPRAATKPARQDDEPPHDPETGEVFDYGPPPMSEEELAALESK